MSFLGNVVHGVEHAAGDLAQAGEQTVDSVVSGGEQLVNDTVSAGESAVHTVAGFLTSVGDGVEDLFRGLFDHVGTPAEMAAQLKQMAQTLEQLCVQMTADAASVSWQGEAADAFRQHTSNLSQQFSQISKDLSDAAGLAAGLI